MTGKRLCSGVTSARATLFRIFTAVLQKYSLQVSPAHPLAPVDDFETGINNKPRPFSAIVKLREF